MILHGYIIFGIFTDFVEQKFSEEMFNYFSDSNTSKSILALMFRYKETDRS